MKSQNFEIPLFLHWYIFKSLYTLSHFSFPLSIYLSSSVPFLHLFLLPYFLLSPLWSFHSFILFSSHSSLISFLLPLLSLSFFPPCIPVFPLLSSHLSLPHSLPLHPKKFSPSILHVSRLLSSLYSFFLLIITLPMANQRSQTHLLCNLLQFHWVISISQVHPVKHASYDWQATLSPWC